VRTIRQRVVLGNGHCGTTSVACFGWRLVSGQSNGAPHRKTALSIRAMPKSTFASKKTVLGLTS
jgi:hypothetical protein